MMSSAVDPAPTPIRSRSRRRALMLAVAGVMLAGAATVPAASAAQSAPVVTAVGLTFVPPETTIDQGSSLTFINVDPVPHNVTARETGDDSQPIFRSETIRTGSSPVAGVEALGTGTYSYYCTVHPWMAGLLTVE